MNVVKVLDSVRAEKLTRMVDEYQTQLLNLCYMYLRDRSLAEDAVQDTFLKAYRNLGTFRGECSEKTWLVRIAVNTCRDMRRNAWFTHVNRSITPEGLNESACPGFDQTAADLGDAIISLPDKYKEVILLYYYQDMSMQDIASAVGISASMVSRRIKKACAKLKTALEKEYLYE